MKKRITFSFLCLALSLFTLHAQELTFCAYGDTRDNASNHMANCDIMNAQDPDVILNTGDLWDEYHASGFRLHYTSRANLNDVLQSNNLLVARGNHEDEAEVLNFRPKITCFDRLQYWKRVKNVLFICTGMHPDADFIHLACTSAEADSATFKIAFSHTPVYSSGSHGAEGMAEIEQACDTNGIDIFFHGHDHHYERTFLMYNQQIADEGSDIPADKKGTIYCVTGGGAVGIRSCVANPAWSHNVKNVHHTCRVLAYNDRLEVLVTDKYGAQIDSYTRYKNAPAVPTHPRITITSPLVFSSADKDTTLTITADAVDGNGTVTEVEIFVNDSSIGFFESPPYAASIYLSKYVDDYNIRVTAKDNDGETGERRSTFSIRNENVALNKPSVIHNRYDSHVEPGNMNDGDMGTRASSVYADNQEFIIDLRNEYIIDQVRIFWEAAFVGEYKILTGLTDSTWTEAYSITDGDGDLDDIRFVFPQTRYLKLLCITPGTPAWAPSIWEFEAYGIMMKEYVPEVRPDAVETTLENSGFVLYPNPSSGLIHIELSKEIENATINALDLSGKKMYTENLSSLRTYSLNLEDLPAGVYILEIKNTHEAMYKKIRIE